LQITLIPQESKWAPALNNVLHFFNVRTLRLLLYKTSKLAVTYVVELLHSGGRPLSTPVETVLPEDPIFQAVFAWKS
ncbi:hypothetical protein, partial [Gracilibacillus saliphilus]|uniref:hypothetical protein n=1 Tax=Gracilibacillus saliphilus TaxID=543890 RepID=UPI001EE2E230